MPVAVHPAGGVIRFLTDAADGRIYVRRAAPIQLNGSARPDIYHNPPHAWGKQKAETLNNRTAESMRIGGIDG